VLDRGFVVGVLVGIAWNPSAQTQRSKAVAIS
jgi:hypothetical protein